MSLFDAYFHAPHRAARSYLLGKLFLVAVALDAWMLMIGHAGRYGVDGFNVAQFAWLDRIQPLPSAALYVGVLLLTGLLALSIALGAAHVLARAALFLLYTYSWSMSMLDSYQHHYFVSSILLCLVFFPQLSALQIHPSLVPPKPDAGKKKKQQQAQQERAAWNETSGFIYFAVCVLAGLVYVLVDAKQHPWLLFAFCTGGIALATLLYKAERSGGPLLVSAFGFNLLGATVGILYTYTSIAKMDAQWCAGNTMKRISSAERVFAPLVDWVVALGVPRERFWSLFASSVIPVELCIAVGYLLAVRQDASDSRLLRVLCSVAFVLALSVHVGAEAMGLEIGWFSYYMMLLACGFLLPGPVVDKLATLLTWPARFFSLQLADFSTPPPGQSSTLPTLLITAATGAVLCAVGYMVDLPGALAATSIAAAVLCAVALVATLQKHTARVRPALLGTAVAAALMWTAIAQSEVRWDFYRYLGGDLRRRNQPEAALIAYERGERYAPKGQSRADKIQELKQQLGKP